jgi:hypothetical protein
VHGDLMFLRLLFVGTLLAGYEHGGVRERRVPVRRVRFGRHLQ